MGFLPYETAIKSIGDFFKSIFDFAKTSKEHQSETEIIKDKRDYKEATNIAEKIIDIAQKYKTEMTFADRLKFYRLLEKFQEHN